MSHQWKTKGFIQRYSVGHYTAYLVMCFLIGERIPWNSDLAGTQEISLPMHSNCSSHPELSQHATIHPLKVYRTHTGWRLALRGCSVWLSETCGVEYTVGACNCCMSSPARAIHFQGSSSTSWSPLQYNINNGIMIIIIFCFTSRQYYRMAASGSVGTKSNRYWDSRIRLDKYSKIYISLQWQQLNY